MKGVQVHKNVLCDANHSLNRRLSVFLTRNNDLIGSGVLKVGENGLFKEDNTGRR